MKNETLNTPNVRLNLTTGTDGNEPSLFIEDGERVICDFPYGSANDPKQIEEAGQIVKAVNNHQALVDALDSVVEHSTWVVRLRGTDDPQGKLELDESFALLRDALRNARTLLEQVKQ